MDNVPDAVLRSRDLQSDVHQDGHPPYALSEDCRASTSRFRNANSTELGRDQENVGPVDREAILDAIRTHAVEAADALDAIQTAVDGVKALVASSLLETAKSFGEDAAEFWLQRLEGGGLVTAFVNALRARGVNVDPTALDDPTGSIPFEKLAAFLPRANAFRCRVIKNGKVAGSGVLVGPSLVLTSWHVISVNAPGQAQVPAPALSVLLSDQSQQMVHVPAKFESECGTMEYTNVLARMDSDVLHRHDVALLAMNRPAAAHLGFAPLTIPAPTPQSKNRLVLIHFPAGQDEGVDFGFSHKIRNMRARWRHDVPTKRGSSGGACFDRDLQLIGVHQGAFDNTARFVPLDQVGDALREHVIADVAPTSLWSLDGTAAGDLVVGRSLYFEALASTVDPSSRVRGVRIKRRKIDAGPAGLAFSHNVLEKLLTRRGPSHLVVRVSQEELVPDLVADIRRRVGQRGLDVPEPTLEPGVAPGQAPPETAAKDRAATLAAGVQAIAADRGLTVWFFFDNPSVSLSESARLSIEGFVDAALMKPNLRLVIAGFETMPLPGLEFAGPNPPATERAPGLVVEFIGGFVRSDVVDMLTRASLELTGAVDAAVIAHETDIALLGLDNFNGVYADEALATASERLRPTLALFESQRPQQTFGPPDSELEFENEGRG